MDSSPIARPLPLTSIELKDAVQHGGVMARCLWRKTVNPTWDVASGMHATDWAPAHIKSSFYDMKPGCLSMEPFDFTDEGCSVVEGVDGAVVLKSGSFEYEFKEGDSGADASEGPESR